MKTESTTPAPSRVQSFPVNGLTAAQSRKLAAAQRKLPTGYSYRMHDELDGGKTADAPYGVTVLHAEEAEGGGLGYTYRKDGHVMGQLYTGQCEQMNVVRLALNRAAAAIWGQQTPWPAEYFYREAR